MTTDEKPEDWEQAPILTRLADIRAEEVSFLWHPYLPTGKLCFLDGAPGLGKTWIALDIAARLSRGAEFPEDPGTNPLAPESVIYMSLEDGLGDTLRPRLEQLGADLSRVFILEGWSQGQERGEFTLHHLNVLGDAIAQIGAKLVVLDPVLAYLQKGHHHSEGARRVMSRLRGLSERYRCTILGLRHLTKGGQIRGSIEIQAAARSSMLVGKDPTTGCLVMAHSKASLTPLGSSLVYSLDEGSVEWVGCSLLTAADLLAKKAESPILKEAGEFLLEELRQGPKPSREVESKARAYGISPRTLSSARRALGIECRRVGGIAGEGRWEMFLPNEAANPAIESVAVLAEQPAPQPDWAQQREALSARLNGHADEVSN